MNILELSKPIMINDKQVTSLKYNMHEIDSEAYMRAAAECSKFSGKMSIQETDYGFHLYLGFEGILAVNKDIDINDLKRIKGRDLSSIALIGRSFLLISDGDSDQKLSDEQSEITQEPTTQTLEQ